MQDKTKLVATTALAFMRAADKRINAADMTRQYETGSRSYIKAMERLGTADANYEAARIRLETVISEVA